ncbi:MAG: hypothetical protein D6705_13870 [Deltaproteobacteria bacterium]|nr:MAG: hypothetical protein D6705_13870 [Deltaproteobacteria bacterium]
MRNRTVRVRSPLALARAGLAVAALAVSAGACDKSGGTNAPAAGEAIAVPPATFAPDSHASDAVQAECGLQESLPRYVEKYSRGRAVYAPSGEAASGKVLEITITNVVAPAGGAFSGPKHMKIHARLLDGGQEVDSVDVDRSTTQGGYGNCDMLRRIAAALGKDLARWLASRG